jgi:hypothetical protein
MTTTGQPEEIPLVRESSLWTRSIQLIASFLKRSLAVLIAVYTWLILVFGEALGAFLHLIFSSIRALDR